MKNVNRNEDETEAAKKLTVDDLKKVIGASAQPRRGEVEEKGTGKIVVL